MQCFYQYHIKNVQSHSKYSSGSSVLYNSQYLEGSGDYGKASRLMFGNEDYCVHPVTHTNTIMLSKLFNILQNAKTNVQNVIPYPTTICQHIRAHTHTHIHTGTQTYIPLTTDLCLHTTSTRKYTPIFYFTFVPLTYPSSLTVYVAGQIVHKGKDRALERPGSGTFARDMGLYAPTTQSQSTKRNGEGLLGGGSSAQHCTALVFISYFNPIKPKLTYSIVTLIKLINTTEMFLLHSYE